MLESVKINKTKLMNTLNNTMEDYKKVLSRPASINELKYYEGVITGIEKVLKNSNFDFNFLRNEDQIMWNLKKQRQ